MSEAKIKRDFARLMIEECDHILASIDGTNCVLGFRQDTKELTRIRRQYWEKVEDDAILEYNLEGAE